MSIAQTNKKANVKILFPEKRIFGCVSFVSEAVETRQTTIYRV